MDTQITIPITDHAAPQEAFAQHVGQQAAALPVCRYCSKPIAQRGPRWFHCASDDDSIKCGHKAVPTVEVAGYIAEREQAIRERDEAIALARRMKDMVSTALEMRGKARVERDEARADRDRLHAAITAHCDEAARPLDYSALNEAFNRGLRSSIALHRAIKRTPPRPDFDDDDNSWHVGQSPEEAEAEWCEATGEPAFAQVEKERDDSRTAFAELTKDLNAVRAQNVALTTENQRLQKQFGAWKNHFEQLKALGEHDWAEEDDALSMDCATCGASWPDLSQPCPNCGVKHDSTLDDQPPTTSTDKESWFRAGMAEIRGNAPDDQRDAKSEKPALNGQETAKNDAITPCTDVCRWCGGPIERYEGLPVAYRHADLDGYGKCGKRAEPKGCEVG